MRNIFILLLLYSTIMLFGIESGEYYVYGYDGSQGKLHFTSNLIINLEKDLIQNYTYSNNILTISDETGLVDSSFIKYNPMGFMTYLTQDRKFLIIEDMILNTPKEDWGPILKIINGPIQIFVKVKGE